MNHRPKPAGRAVRMAIASALWVALAAATALATPTLDISPMRVAPGDVALMTLDGFAPGGYDATVVVDGAPGPVVFIPFSGHLAFFWPVPASMTPGGHDIYVCANCNQGDIEERTNTVRLIVDSGNLTGSEYNLQPWGVEITQGVRGAFPIRVAPGGSPTLAPESVVHVANRRTVVRVYPWVEGGPDFERVRYVKAYLWVKRGTTTYGPITAENRLVSQVRPEAVLNDLRENLTRTWNFVLPPEAVRLGPSETSATFDLTITINPDEPGRVPECASCFDDNTIYLNGNEIRHVGVSNGYAMKFRPFLVEAEVTQPDATVDLIPRPTLFQLDASLRSFYDVLPIGDGARGVRLMPWRFVDWSGTPEEWDPVQDAYLIDKYLPGGVLDASPPNDYYGFLYWGGEGCAGHAELHTPFFRTSACGAPPYVAAHELNHAIGAAHAGNGHGEIDGGGFDPAYPGWHGQVEPDSWGLNVYTMQVHPPTVLTGDGSTHDFMSYGHDAEWVSRYTWNLTAANLGSPAIDPGKASGLPSLLTMPTEPNVDDYVAFRGLVNAGGQLDLAPFFSSWQPGNGQGDGTYLLEFRDINDDVLTTLAPDAVRMQDIDQTWSLFAQSIAVPTGWRRLVLRENGVEIQSWLRSAHLPAVNVTSPVPGFQWPNSGQVDLTWSASDADNDPLHFRVLALHGADNELFTLASNLTGSSFTIDRATLPGGGDWTIIVEASDGFDRVFAPFVSGWVDPMPPQVRILEPVDGSVQVAGSKVPAMGVVADIQGDIPDGNHLWYLDGNYVDFGSSVELPAIMTPGPHQLQFTVNNAFQQSGSSTVQFEVVDSLAPPTLSGPANGAPAVPQPVTLTWLPVPGAISYRLQLANDPNFGEVLGEAGNLTTTEITFNPGQSGHTFYWRAMSEHGTAPSDWSPGFSFTTGDVTSAVDPVPHAAALDMTVFPNPFNPSTTVAFDLPRAGVVTIEVFDLAGRRVRSLLDESLEAGLHSVTWNGRDDRGVGVGSGVYLVKLVTPAGTVSRQVLMLK